MKQIIILFTLICLSACQQLSAQHCIDTVHVKGYYVIKKKANEISPQKNEKGDKVKIEQPIDVHYDPSFVPCDSITQKRPLSYWLNHFFDDTKQVFISCEKFGIKYFVGKECLSMINNQTDTCDFPTLRSKVLYETTNLNTGDVFEIYYIDAYWAKIKIKRNSPEVDIIPSKIAQRCISPSVSEFDLYCFIGYEKINMSPKIKDKYIRIAGAKGKNL